MNAEVFAEWLRRQGHRVVKTENSYWYDGGPRVYQAFPYHWLIDPSPDELGELFKNGKAMALRYSTPLTAFEGLLSYHAVLGGGPYGMQTLPRASRQNVKRGLTRCTVRRIPLDMLADEGWKLQVDTLDRQNRKLDVSAEAWRVRCLAARDLEGFEAWGAFVNDHLAASVMTFRMDDWIYMLYQQCRREFLPMYVNNALAFTVTQEVLGYPGVRAILYGLHSLDAPPSVDEFKFRMGYQARPLRQRVAVHPIAAPLFRDLTHSGVKAILRCLPGNPVLSKAEGILRFYLQGRLPLKEQPVPPPIRKVESEVTDLKMRLRESSAANDAAR